LRRSKISSKASSHQIVDGVEEHHTAVTLEVEVIEAEEGTVGAEVVEEDGAAHECYPHWL